MKRRSILLLLIIGLISFLIYEFWAAPPLQPLSQQIKVAVWMSIEWSMDSHTDAEIQALADELQANSVDYALVYVSYLKAGNVFNPTYDHAAEFTHRMKTFAPDITLLAWVGVPIGINQPDGTFEANRLQREIIRQQIADFALLTVDELGFDGFHLNAEILTNGDAAFLVTLQTIRETLPDEAMLSTTFHALRVPQSVTLVPYPTVAHHVTPEYLQQIALYADQITLMAYDSGLPFPRDYRAWIQYQTEASAAALADSDVELLIGLPVSEEWTPSHQTQAETLASALSGFRAGYNEKIAGIVIYPHWELSTDEWIQVQQLQSE
jgi:hypothetical protein